jgi:phosphate:Na+ symporter
MISILTLLGGLGMFLFGMRTMSAGLQKAAGAKLRGLLTLFTKNRFAGIVSGFVMTCSVQSSSATTVMILSFSNAGLLTLTQAIGPIMGANIGTTITGWLISTLGFQIEISSFALPVIGVGFALTMLKGNREKYRGEVLIGFGLLFLGLSFLKDAVPHIDPGQSAGLEFLREWATHGFGSVILFIAVGTVLTVVIQSSSATMAITLTLAHEGWIDLEVAAAMVLGENIGTTITAYLASIGSSRTAKRVARSHFLFNIIGVLWVVPVIYPFLSVLRSVVPGGTTIHLAAFHSCFNIINTGVLMWFIPQIQRVIEWWIPYTDAEKDQSQIRYFDAGLQETPELAVVEVRRALLTMTAVVHDMFCQIENVIQHPEIKLGDLIDEIKLGEDRTDDMEAEVVEFCTALARQSTSPEVAREIAAGFDMANDIERMGDHCLNLVLLAQRAYDHKYRYTEDSRAGLDYMMRAVREFISLTMRALEPGAGPVLAEAKVLENKINVTRDQARRDQAQLMQGGETEIRAGLVYLDMMTNFEKLGDYCYNVAKMVSQRMRRR